MKKFCVVILLLILGTGAFAESDIQITTQPFSLYQYKYIQCPNINPNKWDPLTYMASLVFEYNGNVCEITNHNYWDNFANGKIGLYESLNFMAYNTFGLGLAVGPCLKFYEDENVLISGSAGVHSVFYGIDHIEFGVETDFRVKALKNKRFSPVGGLALNFDFLTNGNAKNTFSSWLLVLIDEQGKAPYVGQDNLELTVVYDPTIVKFIAFYVMPYIAFSINF